MIFLYAKLEFRYGTDELLKIGDVRKACAHTTIKFPAEM